MEFDINSAKIAEDNEPQFDINSATDTDETEIIYDPEQDKTIEAPIGLKPREITYLDAIQNKKEKPSSMLGGVMNDVSRFLSSTNPKDLTATGVRTPNQQEDLFATPREFGKGANITALSIKRGGSDFLTQVSDFSKLVEGNKDWQEVDSALRSIGLDTNLANLQNEFINELKVTGEQESLALGELITKRQAEVTQPSTAMAGGAATSIVPSILWLAGTKNASGLAALWGATESGTMYRELKEGGLSTGEAQKKASAYGTIIGAINLIGGEKIINYLAKDKALLSYLGTSAVSGAQEGAETTANIAVKTKAGLDERTLSEKVSDVLRDTLFGTVFGAASRGILDIPKLLKEPIASAELEQMKEKLAERPELITNAIKEMVETELSPVAIDDLRSELKDTAKVIKAIDEDLPMDKIIEQINSGVGIDEAIKITRETKRLSDEQQKIISTLEAEAQAISQREADLMQPQITDTDPEVIKARINKLDSDLAALDDRIDAQQDIISERFKAGKSTKAVENKLDKLLTQRETIATELAALETADRRNVASKGMPEKVVVAQQSEPQQVVEDIAGAETTSSTNKNALEQTSKSQGGQLDADFSQEQLDKNDKELRSLDYFGAIDWLIENAPTSFEREWAVRIKERALQLKEIGFEFELDVVAPNRMLSSGARGVSIITASPLGVATKIQIRLNPATEGASSGVNYTTVMHEFLHSITQAQIKLAPNDPSVKSLEELHQLVIKEFNKKAKLGQLSPFESRIYNRSINALQDSNELLAWGLTDKDMQEMLASIPVSPSETLFSKFVDILKRILKFPEGSALERLITLSDKITSVDLAGAIKEANKKFKSFGKQENDTAYPSWSLVKDEPPIFVKDNIALYKAKSMLGSTIYLAGKKDGDTALTTFVDIRNYTGDIFNADELVTLREQVAQLKPQSNSMSNLPPTTQGKGISEQAVVAAESPIRNLIKGIRNKKFIQQGTVDTLRKELVKRVNDYLKSNPQLKENTKDKFQSALEGIKNFDDLKRKAAMLDSVLSRAERSLRQPTAEDDYQRVANFRKPNIFIRASENIKDVMAKVGRIFDNALTPVSGVLKRIDPKLKAMLREYEFSHFDKANEWAKMNETWFKRVSKLPNNIKNQLDFAMKNSDVTKINEIIREYDLETEFATLRETLDNIIKELNSAGVKVPYRQDYFPRSIKDTAAFMEYIRMQEGWAYLSEAIDKKEIELERPMTEEEMAQFLNNYMRYGAEDIRKTDIKFAQTKERSIERVTPEMNQFYQDSDQALLMYFKSAAHAISAAKFFGKGNIEKIGTNLEASIGKFILDKMASGELTPAQAQRVAEILRARFKEAKMYELMGAIKNLSYATTMGQLSSAITQIGDLGLAVYRNGFMRSAVGLGKSLVGAKRLTVQDIGVQNILQEFSDNTLSSKVLDVVFRANLLRYVDRLGKETIINGSLSKFRALAKKPTNQFLDDMDLIFGDRAEQVIDELKSGQTTEGIKLLVFNDLLENQPVTESEMPLYYLKHPNGRIFYMLKTYTLKVFDIYRDDVIDLARTNPKQAVTNFTRLTVLLAIAGAAASELKDWLAGEDVDFSDNVISSLLSIMGISKWDIITAKKDSVTEAVVQKVAPPTRLAEVVEQIVTGDERAIKAVPAVGKIIYDQKTPEERRREKEKQKTRVELIENN